MIIDRHEFTILIPKSYIIINIFHEPLATLVSKVIFIDDGISEVRNGYELFKSNATLKGLPAYLEFQRFTSMYKMCYGCTALTHVRQLETENVTDMIWVFYGCSSLQKIDTTFTTCRNLQNVRFSGTINVDIFMNGCPKLAVDSLLSLLNALADGVTDKTCKIGSTNLAKLTDAQKAIATDKGWTLE